MPTDRDDLPCFNIYYLNLSKVYEISMMIDNVVPLSVQKERSISREVSRKKRASLSSGFGLNSQRYLAEVKSAIGAEREEKSTGASKLIESLDVKTTKSILLRSIVERCQPFCSFDSLHEGDLVKLDNVILHILNEDNLRQILILRNDALKGFRVEGMEISNLFASLFQDYSYVLYGDLGDDKEIVIKVPFEIQNEFESQYKVDDLLIGHITVIGIYKGRVTERFITSNTFNYLASSSGQQSKPEKKVFPSSKPQIIQPSSSSPSSEKDYQFIDVIALIQDVHFDSEVQVPPKKLPWYQRLVKFFFRRKSV